MFTTGLPTIELLEAEEKYPPDVDGVSLFIHEI